MKSAVVISTSSDSSISKRVMDHLSNLGIKTRLIRIDSSILENGTFSLDTDENYFVENDHSAIHFCVRKLFFQKNIHFHSFGFIDDSDNIVCSEGSLDIGSDLDRLKMMHDPAISNKESSAKNFNGLLAIDPPPDSIPSKYMFHFRYPLNIAKAYISIMDKADRSIRHSPVKILSRPGTVDVSLFFRKRAVICGDISELEPGTTVITWSTTRFFTLLKQGFRPVPGTRCLALWAYGNKKRNISNMILENPIDERVQTIRKYILSRSTEKILF